MFINRIEHNIVDNFGRILKRTTTTGKYYNKNIISQCDYFRDKLIQKSIIAYDENGQKTLKKELRNGKFERLF